MTKQAGFNLITIVIAAAVLLAGLIVWSVAASVRQASSPAAMQERATRQKAEANKGYVVIKEWNLRFKPVEGLMGTVYVVGSQRHETDENITFSTEELASYGDDCAGKVDGRLPLGMLTRSKTPVETFAAEGGEFVKHIGDYYYRYTAPRAACGNGGNSEALQTALQEKFKPSIGTLEMVK